MPDGKTPITNFNPNEFKVVDNSKKTVTDFNPNEFKIVGKAPNQLREGDASVVLPKYKTPQDLKIDSAIDFIKQKGGRNGSTIMDSELDVLKDVLKDTRATEDQRKRAIATIQGYDSKHDDNNTMYYNKLEDNGVYVPTALAYGEKPPKGYKVASVWGNQNQSNNDNALTDISKSIFNGVIGAVEGVIDVAQIGKTLITGEESKYLNKLGNTAEALKFNKDKDLDTPILNTEGVEKWSDLLDKDRFDLSPKALWGAFNMAAESLVGFAGGAKGATTITKGGKGFVQGLKGVGKEFVDEFGSVQNAITLGENATKATIFAGSFANQVGSVYESAKDAGLKGRDAAGFATAVAAPMAALDAFWGLDGKVMSELFYNQKKNLLKNVVKEVEKDAAGNITENGFKQLTKEMTIGYSDLVKKGVKEVVKDAVSEGGQEAAQDFTQKAGEQLWDKLTPDERGQFGTDAFNAKSFGDYINSFATSLIPGGGMSIGTQLLRTKHDEQSINAYERVKQGPEAVTALKTDLGQALKNNDINQSEYDQAIFKIDSYDKYHQETKGVNLKPEDERKAFELSFQIQGLKTEIPTNENEISKLDPIPRSKVESKQKQVKELQSELNDIIRQGEIKGEPVVPKKEEERIQKEKEKAQKESEKESKVETFKPSAPKKEVIKKNVIVQPKLPKQPHWKEDTRSYEDIDNETFNNQGFDARTKFRTIVEKLDKEPSKESNALLIKRPYKYWDGEKWKVGDVIEAEFSDGKRIRMASSKKLEAGYRGWFREERTLGNEEGLPVGVKVIDLNNPRGEKVGEDYVPGRKILKIYDKRTGKFLSWAKETKLGKVEALDKNDQVLTTKEQGDFIKSLEQQEYNEPIAGEGEIAEIIKPKPKPTPTERAAEATQKIVEEAKTKVKEQKASVPLTITKAVRQQLYDLKFSKANVDSMKPERALEIINKQEVKSKEDSSKKEPTEIVDEEKAFKELEKKEEKKRKANSARDKKVVAFEQAEINRISKTVPKTLREAILRYFAQKGKVTTSDFYRYIGKKDRNNYNVHFWSINNDKKFSADTIAKKIWEEDFERSEETFDEQAVIEEIFDVLNSHNKPTEIFQSLIKEHAKVNEEELPNGFDEYIKEQDAIEKEFLDKEAEEDFNARQQAENELGENFQKVSQRKGDFSKVVEVISKAFNNKHIKVVEDANQFKGEQSTVAGKVSSDGKFIYINPNYAGLDTPIHEGGHILIDAMGYNNKVIQSAIKQLRGTDLYSETKERYPELSEQELDKEVLAEAIGREGADIFDSVADRSKFKTYLDYIFDWLKQKLGMDKNIAKSLAKQIIGGVKTKNIEGTNTGKEQLQKVNEPKQKNPLGARPLKFEQYAAEHGFSYEKETDKIEEASYLLKEAQDEYDIAKENAEVANTDEEAEPLEKILAEKEVALKAAKKNFAIKGKRTFEYKKYRKDFNEIKKLMAEKDIDNYTTEELQDLISKLHSFDNKAAKAVRTEAMLKFAMIATKKQQQVFEGKTGYIAELGKTKDITPLQRRILHHSHFSENNADMQAVSLAFGNAIMDKITDANTKKATHEKLGQKVIAEENKKLGIIGAQTNRFSSDSAKYFEWMSDKDGNLMTIDEAKAKGLSEAKINYLKFTRETIADYRGQLEENNFENAVMQAIRIDKGFMEAYKSEGLLPAFSYYLGGGANNLGKVRIEHNGQIKSYSEIEKEILATANRKSITSMAKALFDLLVANIKARYQLKKGFNVDEKENPLELKGEAEYSLNEKGQLVSKFDKPRAKDRGYSKDFYKAMNQFIDESAHTKHISKIMPLVDSVEYLNKNGYMDEGYVIKPNVAKWIEDWKKLHIFKEQHVNDPVLDASIKAMRNLVASTTMWFNISANVLNVFMGNYSNWRQENGKVVALGNKRLFGGNAKNRAYGLDLIKKYNLVNQDYDSNATMKAGSILSKIATWGTKVGEYQIQGSLGLGLLTEDEFNSFEYTKDKYGNEVLTVKEGVDEAKIKAKMIQIKNRVTDIQGKYPDEDRRNIMKGEIGKAAFQFKVWMPDWFKERFGAKYINAYGQEKEGTFRQLMRTGIKEMYTDLKKGDFKNIYKNNPSFMSNLKGLATIGTLIALSHMDDDDEEVKKGSLTFQNALSQVLFILDLEQDKYMVSNPVAALGKTKDLISAFEALVTLDEKAIDKVKRVIPGNKITKAYELGKKVID